MDAQPDGGGDSADSVVLCGGCEAGTVLGDSVEGAAEHQVADCERRALQIAQGQRRQWQRQRGHVTNERGGVGTWLGTERNEHAAQAAAGMRRLHGGATGRHETSNRQGTPRCRPQDRQHRSQQQPPAPAATLGPARWLAPADLPFPRS